MQYDIQKHELTLDINDSRVKLTFESDVPESAFGTMYFLPCPNRNHPLFSRPLRL